MINSFYNSICKILRRQENSRDDFGEYTYSVIPGIPCVSMMVTGDLSENENAINDLERMSLCLSEEVYETDRIVFDSYEWDIEKNGILKSKSLIYGNVEYYKLVLIRHREYVEEIVEIKRR